MRNKSSGTNKLTEILVMGLLLCSCCSVALSLPEDEFQKLTASASRNDIDMANGIVIYYGTTENPAVITRGSMRISGLTITVEQANGELMKVTAEGNPARFQHHNAASSEPAPRRARQISIARMAYSVRCPTLRPTYWARATASSDRPGANHRSTGPRNREV